MPSPPEPREPWLDDPASQQLDRELRTLAEAIHPPPAFLAAHDRDARRIVQSARPGESSRARPGRAEARADRRPPPRRGEGPRRPRYAMMFGLAIAVCLVASGVRFLPAAPAHTAVVVTASPGVAGGGMPAATPLPAADSGSCPRTSIARAVPDSPTGGIGDGPIYLAGPRAADNVFTVPPVPSHAQAGFELIVLGDPTHAGPVRLRSRGVGGSGSLRFAGPLGPATEVSLAVDRATTLPSGWHRWSVLTIVDPPGCYAIQLDGATFGEEVVIEIVTR